MVSVLGNNVYTPLNYFFVALAIAAFIVEAWAFVDAIIRPAAAFLAAATMMDNSGKLTKPIWLIILGVAFVLGLYSAAYGGVTGFLSVLAFVAAAVYLAAVRPKVREFRKGSRSLGPLRPLVRQVHGPGNTAPNGPWQPLRHDQQQQRDRDEQRRPPARRLPGRRAAAAAAGSAGG